MKKRIIHLIQSTHRAGAHYTACGVVIDPNDGRRRSRGVTCGRCQNTIRYKELDEVQYRRFDEITHVSDV